MGRVSRNGQRKSRNAGAKPGPRVGARSKSSRFTGSKGGMSSYAIGKALKMFASTVAK